MALIAEPLAMTTDAMSPTTISEKYSGALKWSAICARGGAKSAMSSVETVPAKNDPIPAVAKALPRGPA